MKPSNVRDSWYKLMEDVFNSEQFIRLKNWLKTQKPFSPNFKQVFRIFSMLDVTDCKVIIIGEEPYSDIINNTKIATGIPFGINSYEHDNIQHREIRNALYLDTGEFFIDEVFDPTLESWVTQGVMLFNIAWTSKIGKSHIKQWEFFSKELIVRLNKRSQGVVFVFMGDVANKYSKLVDKPKNSVIKVHHPLDYYKNTDKKFSYQKTFTKINNILEANSMDKIDFVNSKKPKPNS